MVMGGDRLLYAYELGQAVRPDRLKKGKLDSHNANYDRDQKTDANLTSIPSISEGQICDGCDPGTLVSANQPVITTRIVIFEVRPRRF